MAGAEAPHEVPAHGRARAATTTVVYSRPTRPMTKRATMTTCSDTSRDGAALRRVKDPAVSEHPTPTCTRCTATQAQVLHHSLRLPAVQKRSRQMACNSDHERDHEPGKRPWRPRSPSSELVSSTGKKSFVRLRRSSITKWRTGKQ